MRPFEDPRWLSALARNAEDVMWGVFGPGDAEDGDAGHDAVPWELVELYLALEADHGAAEVASIEDVSIEAAGDSPFHSRAEVGLRPPRAGYSAITSEGITAHHGGPSPWSGGRFDHARCAGIWRGWQSFHMDDPARRWNDIAYTSAVCPHGHRYEGRPAGARTAAQGSNDGNSRSEATVYLGGTGDALTDEAKRAYRAEAVRLGRPLRWVHHDWTDTECPGAVITPWIRAGAPSPGGPPPTPAPPKPAPKETDMDLPYFFDAPAARGGGLWMAAGIERKKVHTPEVVTDFQRLGARHIGVAGVALFDSLLDITPK